jgi:signal transduction histidine kinase
VVATERSAAVLAPDREPWADAAIIDGPDGGPLGRIALALTSTLELQEVLERIVSVALDTSGASRASLLLLDGDRLVPTVALGAVPNEDAWLRFRAMSPIDVGPLERSALEAGRAIGLADARGSELVPRPWTATFGLRRMALVPLMSSGAPCGLMVVDWPEPAPFTAAELARLETVAAFAGLAVRNARLFEQQRRSAALQATLARAAGELVASLEPQLIARRLVPAFVGVLRARACGIALLDVEHGQFTTLASYGVRRSTGPVSFADVPAHIVEALTERWDVARGSAVELEDAALTAFLGADVAVSRYLVMPLVVDGHSRGLVLLGFNDETVLDADERAAAEALAALAAAAMERQALVDRLNRQVRQLDALHLLSGALTERADASMLVAGLNDLLSGHGIGVTGIAFRDRKLARYLAAEDSAPGSRDSGASPASDGDSLSVPMYLGRRNVGELYVRSASHDDLAFLRSLAAGLAEIVNRGALRAAAEGAARERAVAAERDRMAAGIHDTAGQMFVAMGLLARRYAEQADPSSAWVTRANRLAELADRGKWETDQAVRALAFLPASQRGLVPALRALAQSFSEDSGIDVAVTVEGRLARLTPKVERALYRVAHEALINAWRHAQCRSIRAEIVFADDVVLRVVDDGTGLDAGPAQAGIHMGIASMRRTMDDCGGSLRVANAEPHGLLMEATLPRERR